MGTATPQSHTALLRERRATGGQEEEEERRGWGQIKEGCTGSFHNQPRKKFHLPPSSPTSPPPPQLRSSELLEIKTDD